MKKLTKSYSVTIVLSLLLIGVWANYAYTIINLFKIRKEGIEITNEEIIENEQL